MRRVLLGSLLLASACSDTKEPPTPRTFERASDMTVTCLRVYSDDTGLRRAIPPEPLPISQCLRTPASLIDDVGHIIGDNALTNHLYALVTQTARGEVAVVDLTAGRIVDPDPITPGINFLPAGKIPTDIAATPDGKLTFLATGEANRPALFAIDNRKILGASQILDPGLANPPATLTDWPVCALPARPSAVHIIEHRGDTAHPYDVAVVFPGDAVDGARVATFDPTPFLRGAGYDTTPGETVAKGAMQACPISAALPLSTTLPATWTRGPTWSYGVPYLDEAVAASTTSSSAALAACTTTSTSERPTPTPDKATARASGSALDDNLLYIGDANLPIIHVIDISNASLPVELAPLLATSESEPTRPVTIGAIAVSPATRDFKRYLYATDARDGSVMIFDVTDATSARVPLRRPNAVVDPLSPVDRVRFGAPVVSIAFGRTDQPIANANSSVGQSGFLCNPNPNATLETDVGVNYRANSAATLSRTLLPARFRGIFAFATLSTGEVITLDVDDWDAPCRRPDPMDVAPNSVTPAQPAPTNSSELTDPYHAPIALQSLALNTPVSLESFFPVSTPHRARSSYLLRRNTDTGSRVPSLTSIPQLQQNSSPISLAGAPGLTRPIMLPTATDFRDPSSEITPEALDPASRLPADPRFTIIPPIKPNPLPAEVVPPGVRLSWEDPTAHLDQDWFVTYEGEIPGFSDLALTLEGVDDYQALSLSQPAGRLCARGIEDARVASVRANAMKAELAANNLPALNRLDSQLSDYVQVVDQLLDRGDPYWSQPNSCWSPDLATPASRYDACATTFGDANDQNHSRDFPVLEAYDDHFVVGNYFNRVADPEATPPIEGTREYVRRDPANAERLRGLQCCFHGQARFRARPANQWIALGSRVGYLHHIVRSSTDNSCVLDCNPDKTLLSSRALAVPRPFTDAALAAMKIPGRDSVVALRNPMFAFTIWNGFEVVPRKIPDPTLLWNVQPTRDFVWRFTTRGEFVPYSIRLDGAVGNPVNPQSSQYLDVLGSLAIVDGSSQGLVLLDVSSGLASTHAPYF